MKIKFLTHEGINFLKESISENIDKYSGKNSDWIDESYFGEYDKVFPDFELDMSTQKSSETDFNNVKIIYSNLKELRDSQASDERVWAGLCHKQFWRYMQHRWSLEKAKEEDGGREKFIEKNYFFGPDHPKFLNALARLWWIGRITYDETNKQDPFELTRYLCLNDLNGRGSALFAVQFSSNHRLVRIFLKTLMELEKKTKLSREEFNAVKEIMVLWGGKIVLDTLDDEELSLKIKNYVTSTILKERKQ